MRINLINPNYPDRKTYINAGTSHDGFAGSIAHIKDSQYDRACKKLDCNWAMFIVPDHVYQVIMYNEDYTSGQTMWLRGDVK